jgi:6,7-dimethyl-8-ribityllumazine synthase
MAQSFPTSQDASNLRFAIVVSRFNQLITVRLMESCVATLEECGANTDDIDVAWVPGAFEIPQAARIAAESGRYDGVITLGVIVRGGTPHFDYVCNGVTDGVREVMRTCDVPIAFGVLTTDDIDQAFDRTGGSGGDKGREAAFVAIEMANLLRELKNRPAVDSAGRRESA